MITLKGLSEEEVQEVLPDNLIFLGYRGSIAHGMYVPQEHPDSIDDKDVMGVFLGPPSHYVGLGGSPKSETKEKFVREWDCVSYELRKLCFLLLKGNPNVLSLLWLDDRHVLYTSLAWEQLLEIRDAFVSKQAYHSFTGYAHSQFKRMTHFSADDFEELERLRKEHGMLTHQEHQRLQQLEKKYSTGYMGAKRKSLVQRFGYDTKNAAHLIRLQRMCIEFLTEGRLYVERKDSASLLSIKRGEWTLDQVCEESERLKSLATEAYVRSSLPAEPDRDRVNATLMKILRHHVLVEG